MDAENLAYFLRIQDFMLFVWRGCGFGAGTHGSIKGYQYPVTKTELEKAVMTILQNKTNVYRDTIRNYMVDVTNGKNDTIENNYYNDGKNYVTLHIKTSDGLNDYTFRYAGDSLDWANSRTSEIFICYIYDDKGNGGSEGNGKWGQTDGTTKKKMIDLFETEFINKIDKLLSKNHVDPQ